MAKKQNNEKIIEKTEKGIAKDNLSSLEKKTSLNKEETKIEEKVGENKIAHKEADKKIKEEIEKIKSSEKKIEIKKQIKSKKTEAVVNARNLPISTKHSVAICNMIRNKEIDKVILLLEQAEQKRIPVPMKGEIPHRKGIMSGRYPVNALGHFIKSLKVLKANALANELELEKYVIFCKANIAPRPFRRFGRGKFKRTHLTLKLIQPIKKLKKKKIKI